MKVLYIKKIRSIYTNLKLSFQQNFTNQSILHEEVTTGFKDLT